MGACFYLREAFPGGGPGLLFDPNLTGHSRSVRARRTDVKAIHYSSTDPSGLCRLENKRENAKPKPGIPGGSNPRQVLGGDFEMSVMHSFIHSARWP